MRRNRTSNIERTSNLEKRLDWNILSDRLFVFYATRLTELPMTSTQLAESWGMRQEEIRSLFRKEPGVLRIKKKRKGTRPYVALRIPKEIAERVRRRIFV
jgi:hypothetical protein